MTELEALAAAVAGEQDVGAEGGGLLAAADGLPAAHDVPAIIKSEQLVGSTQADELAAQRTGSLPQQLGGAVTGGGAGASGSYTSGVQALDDGGSGTLSDERTAPLVGEAAAAAAAAVLAGAQPSDVFLSPSQLQQLVQSQLVDQAGSGGGVQRSKRNTRQQEQNKMAQQRYRAKRKAQFEALQMQVESLNAELDVSKRDRLEAERLRHEVALLRSKLQAVGGGAAPAAALPYGHGPVPSATASLQNGHGSPMDDLLAAAAGAGGAPASVSGAALAPAPPYGCGDAGVAHPAAVRSAPFGSISSSGAGFQPVGNAISTLPRAGSGPVLTAPMPAPAAAAPATTHAEPQLPTLSPTPQQLRAALVLHYQELQAFASRSLAEAPAGGAPAVLDPAAARRLDQLVLTGVELLKLSLQVKGPGALQLLQGGMPAPAGGDATAMAAAPAAAADSLAQWREVAARLQLSGAQATAVLAWRDAFLQRLDELYGQRLLLKAQLAQDLAGGGAAAPGAGALAAGEPATPAWADALLLQGAASAGYAAPAAAGVALGDLLDGLQANLLHEREAVGALLEQLLTGVLTRAQAAHYLLAGHPFCWNGLAFSHAVASIAPTPPQPE